LLKFIFFIVFTLWSGGPKIRGGRKTVTVNLGSFFSINSQIAFSPSFFDAQYRIYALFDSIACSLVICPFPSVLS
jgi:hypothetical protein